MILMKNKPLISVVVPIYKVEDYLCRCVDSIISQTYSNIEIILVDDGSPDNCPKICDDYKNKDSRIIVVHKENGGLSDARNAGIKVMNGKYVTFIDSDDYVEEDYVEFLYNLIEKYNVKMSICSYKAIYDTGSVLTQANGSEYTLTSSETLEKMLYHEDFNVSTWAKLYDASLFEKVEFPKGKIFEDALTTYKLVDQCDKIAVSLVSKYNYMIRNNSILTGSFSIQKLTLVDAYEEMGNYILKKYPNLSNAVIRSRVYAHISTLRQMVNCKPKLKDKEKEFRKYILKYGKTVLHDRRACKRDKIAILLLFLGNNVFKYSWIMYCKITGRIQ